MGLFWWSHGSVLFFWALWRRGLILSCFPAFPLCFVDRCLSLYLCGKGSRYDGGVSGWKFEGEIRLLIVLFDM